MRVFDSADLFTEGTCYVGLALLHKTKGLSYNPNVSALTGNQKILLKRFLQTGRGAHVAQDSTLGWIPLAESNSAGMRDDREYEPDPPPHVLRIAAFGDSFTYGEDVALHETWEKRLTELAPSIEVLNYGVGAYGLDQAYLRYLQAGTHYKPQLVFIGYMSENIARNVNVFRPFYSRSYADVIFTKPRFIVKNGNLRLLKNPVATLKDHEHFLLHDSATLATLGESDFHYQANYSRGPLDFLATVRLAKLVWYVMENKRHSIFDRDGMYDTRSEAYEVTVKIFDAFYSKALENGAFPVILVFPDLNDQQRSRQKKDRRYAPLLSYFAAKRYRFIDMLTALEPEEPKHTIAELTRASGHYSPLGNRIIANYILAQLKTAHLTSVPEVTEALSVARKNFGMTSDNAVSR